MIPRSRRPFRVAILGALAAVAVVLAPTTSIATAPRAHAAGDVCDLCSINFDPTACDRIGGWPYDSTVAPPPPAVSGGGSAPQPQQPAQPPQPAEPQQPTQPQQPAPQQQQSSGGGARSSSGTGNTSGTTAGTPARGETGSAPADVVATVPSAPSGLAHTTSGQRLAFTWTVAADGGSPLTGYKLILNGGTALSLAPDATSHELTVGPGDYDAVLLATNAVGDSDATAVVASIHVGPTPSASPAQIVVAENAASTSSAPLAAGLALGGLVVVGGGLLTWWWIRRGRSARPVE